VLRYPNMDELTPLFAAPLFPYVVRLAEGQPGELVRFWPVVSVDSGRNFSYALQWFAMAIALSLVSLILSSNLLQAWQRQRPR
jgi:cytochrome oxidase assembly protein ShyY1